MTNKAIFDRLLAGESVSYADRQYYRILEEVAKTRKQLKALNEAIEPEEIQKLFAEVIDAPLHKNTMVFTPFHVNYGKNITLGKNVFINMNCTCLDLGGISIDDEVLIAPNVSLLSESHPVEPQKRKYLNVASIHIKKNAWIGANVTIMPGVTIGVNSVVAAGSIVSKDVPDNTIVGGVPAKILKNLA